MKKKYLFVFFLLIIIPGLFFTVFYFFNQPQTSFPEPFLPDENSTDFTGGDRDEHGCIGSAGYSWCEAKQKCLRIWEEPCEEENDVCGIENCHGLEIICGPNPAEICTLIYEIGDNCRKYAECQIQDGLCQQIENPQFTKCKTCVEDCLERYKDEQTELFECERQCG